MCVIQQHRDLIENSAAKSTRPFPNPIFYPGGQPDPPLFAALRDQPDPGGQPDLGWRVQPDSTRQPEFKDFTFLPINCIVVAFFPFRLSSTLAYFYLQSK